MHTPRKMVVMVEPIGWNERAIVSTRVWIEKVTALIIVSIIADNVRTGVWTVREKKHIAGLIANNDVQTRI